MATKTYTQPLVVISDSDADPSYVTSRLARELQERSSNVVLIPVSPETRDEVERVESHPLSFVINHCLSFAVVLMIVAENSDVAKSVRTWTDSETGVQIIEHPNVSVQQATKSQSAIVLALSLAKAERGQVEFFSVDKAALAAVRKSKVRFTQWGRRPRGRRAEVSEGPPTSLLDHVAAQVAERILKELRPQFEALAEAVEANGVKTLQRWITPQGAGEARPVRRISSRDVKPGSRSAVKAG